MRIEDYDILDANKDWFTEYARAVLQERALPEARDGLLVAQRQLLSTFNHALKMTNKSPYKKSAAVVGSALAYAYTHGDASLYGVLCNLSLPFSMRYPLIEGKGSLGTQENPDMRSADRYTEARPSKIADTMFDGINRDAVPMIQTYTNEDVEPVVLPSIFPNALCNGHSGIGVSMASSTYPHNLIEVAKAIKLYFEKGEDLTLDEIMTVLPGPDFPMGGTVINAKDVRAAFETGHSKVSLKVRGDYTIDGNKIIFTSIPYGAFRSKIRSQISSKIDLISAYICDFEDASNVGKTKIIFTVNRGVDPKMALAVLFKETDLQTTVSYNMNFIYKGVPKLCSIKDLLRIYAAHQREVITRVTTFDRNKLVARIHILDGLLIISSNIDKAISLIKNSADKASASTALQKAFGLDEKQAEAVLNMQLSSLTRLSQSKLQNEKEIKLLQVAECDRILHESAYRDKKILEKLDSIVLQFGDARRTKLVNEEQVDVKPQETPVIKEYIHIDRFDGISKSPQKMRSSGITYEVMSDGTLWVFCDNNKCYKLKVSKIKKDSVSLYQLCKIPSEARVLRVAPAKDDCVVLSVTAQGYVKKTLGKEFNSGTAAAICKLHEGDLLTTVSLADEVDVAAANGKRATVGKDVKTSGRMTYGTKISLKTA